MQHLKFVSAVDKTEAFAEACLFVFGICLHKSKYAERIKFLGILKQYVSKNKKYFRLKLKTNVLLNKKTIFVFHTIFKADFITQIIYCIFHRCLYSFVVFHCSLISAFKKRKIEKMLTIRYS